MTQDLSAHLRVRPLIITLGMRCIAKTLKRRTTLLTGRGFQREDGLRSKRRSRQDCGVTKGQSLN